MWGGSLSSAGNATAVGAYAGVPVVLSLRMQACARFFACVLIAVGLWLSLPDGKGKEPVSSN